MSATYNITTHPLLSKKSKALVTSNPTVFDAVAESAERLLGLHDTSFGDSKVEDAKLAIVLQVNFELEQVAEADVYESVQRKDRTWKFRNDIGAIQPRAKIIADRLLQDDAKPTTRQSSSMAVRNEYGW